jgi:hypothetical protein
VKSVRELGVAGNAVRDAGIADLALCPYEALRHGRFGHEERASNLGGGQAAQEAQRQGNLGAGR